MTADPEAAGEMPADDGLDDFLDVAYGDTAGHVHMAAGRHPYLNESGKYQFPAASFRQSSYQWPEQWTELAEAVRQAAADGADVYLTPYVLSGTQRTKGTAVDRRIIHTDVDDQIDLEKVRKLGGVAVDSGSPGHAQVYVFLSEPVDAGRHQALCRLLCAHLGGDRGKISDNDLLRPPGTVNRKPTVRGGQAVPVRWLIPPTLRRVWNPAELYERLLEQVGEPAPTASDIAVLVPADIATLPERVQAALNTPIGKAGGGVDRSATTMAVVGACKDAGYTLPQTQAIVRLREDLAARLDERTDDDVLTCWLRVVDDRQGRDYDHSLVGVLYAPGETGNPTVPAVLGAPTPTPAPATALTFQSIGELCARVDAAGPRRWLVRGVWPTLTYGVHAAEPKAGKTWNTLDLAVSVASGTSWLGALPVDTAGPVVVFAGEGGEGNVVRRLRAIAAGRDLVLEDLPITVCTRAPHLANEAHLQAMDQHLNAVRPVLVTLDPFYLAAGGANGKDLYAMGELLERPQHLCEQAGTSLFVVTHYNRQRDLKGAARMTGAGPAEWGRVLISAGVISRHTDPVTKTTTLLAELDVQGGEVPDQTLRIRRTVAAVDPDDLDSPLTYAIDVPDGFEASSSTSIDLPPAAAKLLAALDAQESPVTGKALVDWIAKTHGHGLTRQTWSRELTKLRDLDLADYLENGKEHLWYKVRAQGTIL